MMNKSPIDWCDFTWNPVTGCRHTCEYCYARKIAKRFCGDVRINRGSDQVEFDAPRNLYTLRGPFRDETGALLQFPLGFEPTLHEYRLQQPRDKKKPANIFVCSMADLFGDWVPDEWIDRVFDACAAAPWHNYLFLTKNPQRLVDLGKAGRLPMGDNYWYGTTITRQEQTFFSSTLHNCFLSIEPLQAPFEVSEIPNIKWIITGAETGNRRGRVKPEREWVKNIIQTARVNGAAVLIQDSDTMREVCDCEILTQEFPPQLQREDKPIPRCSECADCTSEQVGKRGLHRTCQRKKTGIPARYARTSPPWCPERSNE